MRTGHSASCLAFCPTARHATDLRRGTCLDFPRRDRTRFFIVPTMRGSQFWRRAAACLGSFFALAGMARAADATAAAATQPASPFLTRYASFTLGLEGIPELNQHSFLGVALWQWVLGILYVALACLVSWLIDYIFRNGLKKLTARTQSRYDDLALDAVKGPLRVLVFVLLLSAGLNVLELPAWVETWLLRAFMLLSGGALALMGWRAIDLFFDSQIQRAKPEERELREQLYPLLRKSVKTALVILAVLLVTHNMGLDITSLIASLSIGGLALGLAAQDTLSNLFGAVAVLLDKPFRVGDVVRMGDVEGVVERIGLRSTSVRSPDGHLVHVPNKTVGNATVINISEMPALRTLVNLQLTYDTPPHQLAEAMRLLEEILKADPDTRDHWMGINQFGSSAVVLHLRHWSVHTLDQKAHLAQMNRLHLAIKERFAAAHIEFALPSQTLYMKPPAA